MCAAGLVECAPGDWEQTGGGRDAKGLVLSMPGTLPVPAAQVQSPSAPLTYIRIHVNPKRYPEATMIPWNDRIIYQDDELIVIDKPSAVPCSGGIDNLIENVEGQVALILGQQVHVTGRLDVCTSGVVVLAKKTSGAAFMNQLLSSKKTSDDNNEAKIG